jgi:hypothetical protein
VTRLHRNPDKRLVEQRMLALFQRGKRHLVMGINRGDNRDRVDPRTSRQFAKLGRHLDTGIAPANKLQLFGIEVAERKRPGSTPTNLVAIWIIF